MKRETFKLEPLLTFFFYDHCYRSVFFIHRATPFYPKFFHNVDSTSPNHYNRLSSFFSKR